MSGSFPTPMLDGAPYLGLGQLAPGSCGVGHFLRIQTSSQKPSRIALKPFGLVTVAATGGKASHGAIHAPHAVA